MQALWSYTGNEILLDREFVPVVSHRRGRWQVDFSKLSHTSPSLRKRDDQNSTHPDSETSDL